MKNSAKSTVEKNIFHFIWKPPTVQFFLPRWEEFLEETEIYLKLWNQS